MFYCEAAAATVNTQKTLDCSRLTFQERQLSERTNCAQSTLMIALAKTLYTLFTERYLITPKMSSH